MGLFGPPDIGKMKARRDVDGLIKALTREKDGQARQQAARVLGDLKDARAVEPLLIAFKDGNDELRKKAAQVLVKLYMSSKFDESDKKNILSHRSEIKIPHYDYIDKCSYYTKNTDHTDIPGIDFPL